MPPLDENTLNEHERAFFETGELPPELSPTDVPTETSVEVPEDGQQDTEVDVASSNVEPPQESAESTELNLLRQSLQQERQFRSQIEQRLNEITNRLQPKQQEEPIPDATEDPIGHTAAQVSRMAQQLQALEQRLSQGTQQNEQAQQLQNFVTQVKAHRDEFLKTQPDYMEAYQHLRNIRIADLRDLGVPETEIPQVLLREEINVANAAMQAGRNPAKVIYDVAKRYGYQVKQQQQPQKPADKIAQIKRGIEAAKTSPTSKVEADITLDGLKNMGDRDLMGVVTDDDAWNKIVGGRPGGKSIF